MYPKAEELAEIRQELHDSTNSLTHLLKVARNLLRNESQGITESHRTKIREYLRNAPQDSISARASCLEKEMDLSKEQIYKLLLIEQYKVDRRLVTEELREYVEGFVVEHGATHAYDVKQLTSALIEDIALPRKALYEIVLNAVMRVQRRDISEEDREKIMQFVRNQSDLSDLVVLTESFLAENPEFAGFDASALSKSLMYELLRQTMRKLKRQRITVHDREVVQRQVEMWQRSAEEHNQHDASVTKEDNQQTDAAALCDKIQPLLPHLPRFQLYNVVRDTLQRATSPAPSDEQRRLIHDYVDESVAELARKSSSTGGQAPLSHSNLTTFCDNLQQRIPDLPRSKIYQMVRNRMRRLVTRHLSKEDRLIVKQVVRDALHQITNDEAPSISTLCDIASERIQVPRDALYHLIRSEMTVCRNARRDSDNVTRFT